MVCTVLPENVVSTTLPSVANRLIENLPREDRSRIEQLCEPVDLVFGAVLCKRDQQLRYVYFPVTGFISLVTTLVGHRPLEMGLIGNEGMLGVTLMLGVDSAPMDAVVQGAGTALRMTAVQLRHELRDNPLLQRTLNRYLFVLMVQLAQSSACTHFHEIEPRLACWLLLTHDRAHADHFYLTHEFLADMLGVRRSGVTVAAGALQLRKLIRYRRGEISILDRDGLEAASCECYGALADDYARLLV
jgi:CRP-like cAMP-binding protein